LCALCPNPRLVNFFDGNILLNFFCFLCNRHCSCV
jgi:hypothetical protein